MKLGPYDIRPPVSTCSRKPCTVGKRAARTSVLIRFWLVVTSGSVTTNNASAVPLTLSIAAAMSSARGFQRDDVEVEHSGHCLRLRLRSLRWVAGIAQDRQPAEIGHYFAQQFDPFARKVDGLERQPGDIAARPR